MPDKQWYDYDSITPTSKTWHDYDSYEDKNILHGLWDATGGIASDLYNVVNETGKRGAKKLLAGDVPGALMEVFDPVISPFTQVTNMAYGPKMDPAQAQKIAKETVIDVAGIPPQRFQEAWENRDYDRLLGQGLGALGAGYLGYKAFGPKKPYDVNPALSAAGDVAVQQRLTKLYGLDKGPVPLDRYRQQDLPLPGLRTKEPTQPFFPELQPPEPSIREPRGSEPYFFDYGPKQGELPFPPPDTLFDLGTPFKKGPPPPPPAAPPPAAPDMTAPPSDVVTPPAPIDRATIPPGTHLSPNGQIVTVSAPDSTNVQWWRDNGYVSVEGLRSPHGYFQMVRGDVAPLYLTKDKTLPTPPAPRPEVPNAIREGHVAEGTDLTIPNEVADSKEFVANVTADGYRRTERGPTHSIFKKFISEAKGEFTPVEMWENLKRLLKRDPTPEEVDAAMQRQVRPGEPTGRVAPFAGLPGSPEFDRMAASYDDQVTTRGGQESVRMGQEPPSLGGEVFDQAAAFADHVTDPNELREMIEHITAARRWLRENRGSPVELRLHEDMLQLLVNKLNTLEPPASTTPWTGNNVDWPPSDVIPPQSSTDFPLFPPQPPPAQSGLPFGPMRTHEPADIAGIRARQVLGENWGETRTPEQMNLGDQMKDAEISDFLRQEDVTTPEMRDLGTGQPPKSVWNEELKRFVTETKGEFDPEAIWENLKRILGRDPTDIELIEAMQRQSEGDQGAPPGSLIPPDTQRRIDEASGWEVDTNDPLNNLPPIDQQKLDDFRNGIHGQMNQTDRVMNEARRLAEDGDMQSASRLVNNEILRLTQANQREAAENVYNNWRQLVSDLKQQMIREADEDFEYDASVRQPRVGITRYADGHTEVYIDGKRFGEHIWGPEGPSDFDIAHIERIMRDPESFRRLHELKDQQGQPVTQWERDLVDAELSPPPTSDLGIYGDSAREQAEGARYEAEQRITPNFNVDITKADTAKLQELYSIMAEASDKAKAGGDQKTHFKAEDILAQIDNELSRRGHDIPARGRYYTDDPGTTKPRQAYEIADELSNVIKRDPSDPNIDRLTREMDRVINNETDPEIAEDNVRQLFDYLHDPDPKNADHGEIFQQLYDDARDTFNQLQGKTGIVPDPNGSGLSKALDPDATFWERHNRPRKSDALWKILMDGDAGLEGRPGGDWVRANKNAENLIDGTTNRDTMDVFIESLDEWVEEAAREGRFDVAHWNSDLRERALARMRELVTEKSPTSTWEWEAFKKRKELFVGVARRLTNETAQRWAGMVEAMDAYNAPDTDYRGIMSSAGDKPLHVGETWRGRVIDGIKYFARNDVGAVPLEDILAAPGKMWQATKEATGWGQGGTNVVEGAKKEHTFLREVMAFPSAATTTGDFSFPGRQGLTQILTPQFWAAMPKAVQSFGPKTFDKIDAQIRTLPLFTPQRDLKTGAKKPSLGEELGLKLAVPPSKLGPRAEAVASRWLETGGFLGGEKIPFTDVKNPLALLWKHSVGYPIRATNRAFITYSNHLMANRAQFLFDRARDMSIEALDTGRAPMEGVLGGFMLPKTIGGGSIGFKKNYTPEAAANMNPYHNLVRGKEIADFVNTAIGKAPLKTHLLPYKGAEINLEKAAGVLNMTMFSPGLFFSRARMLNPSTYVMASPFVRKQYTKALISTAAAWYAFTEMAKLADPEAEINNDYTNADFGKVRIGNTRMDPSGGFAQFLVQYGRMIEGGYTSSQTGEYHTFGQGYQPETQLSNAMRFGSNKLNPVAKFAWDIANASEYQPFHVYDRSAQLFVPLFTQDVMGIMKENPELAYWMIPAGFGWGTQTYEKGESKGKLIDPENDWLSTGGGLRDLIPGENIPY